MVYALYFSIILLFVTYAYFPKFKIKGKEYSTVIALLIPVLITLITLNFTLPDLRINPVAFKIFGVDVYWYALWIMLGVGVALFHGIREGRKLGISSDFIFTGIIFILPLSILGARIWYVLFNLDEFSSFWAALSLRGGWSGLGIQGGVLTAVISVIIYCRISKVSLYKAFDILAPGFLIGQIFGRWGNFCNHELYGPLVENVDMMRIFLPRFIVDNMYINAESVNNNISGYYQPMFLYESMLNLTGLIIYFVLRRKWDKVNSGDGLGFYLVWYGMARTITESFRFEGEVLLIGPIRVSILMSVIFMVTGVLFLVFKRLYGPKKGYQEVVDYVKANRIEAVLFDWDGTLLDSKPLIDESFYYVFQKYFPDHELTVEELDTFFGPSLEETFSKFTHDKELIKELISCYREFNIANHDEMVKLFPGVKDVVKYLHKHNIKLGVVSSKRRDVLEQGINLFNLGQYFDVIISGDDVTKTKPDPEGILKAKEALGLSKVLYVGDSVGDIKAGKYANCKTCAVIYDLEGIRNAELVDAEPDKVIYKFYDLVKYVGE